MVDRLELEDTEGQASVVGRHRGGTTVLEGAEGLLTSDMMDVTG